jgi:hypothetical protein
LGIEQTEQTEQTERGNRRGEMATAQRRKTKTMTAKERVMTTVI